MAVIRSTGWGAKPTTKPSTEKSKSDYTGKKQEREEKNVEEREKKLKDNCGNQFFVCQIGDFLRAN
jgi:hypothetical protein